jgi:hypothetical protein
LGNLVKARLNVRDVALGPMKDLYRQIQQPVNLSVRQGDEIVYIERSYSERSGMQVVRAIGGRAPLHLTSVGKLFLAAEEPNRLRAYATRTGLAGQTKNSITQLPALGCDAWRRVFWMTKGSWLPAYRFPPPPVVWMKLGRLGFKPLHATYPARSAIPALKANNATAGYELLARANWAWLTF